MVNNPMRWLSPSLLGLCGLAFVGPVSASADPIEAVIRLQETVPVENLAREVLDPSSSRYRHFYSPEEIRKICGPSDERYASLLSQLESDGAMVLRESPTHLFVTVRAERAYLERIDRLARRRNDEERSTLSLVTSVNGLTDGPKRHSHLKFLPPASRSQTGVSPAQIRTAYGFDALYSAGLTGRGQHIAIATYNSFFVDDVNQYYSNNGVNPAPQVDQVTFNGTPTYDMGSAAETETDAELSGMIAPGAQIHVFASSQNSDAGELQMFTAILDDNRAKIVNYSWGSCEDQLNAAHKADMDKVFARAVAQGVNILVASGDSGSDCKQDGSTVADYPADQPNVVAVGGTTLDASAGTAKETAWNGSGGGISKQYALPSYQAVLGSTYTGRAYPDVAFNADPNSGEPVWIRYDPFGLSAPTSASSQVIGGTSIAAPQWSGFLALVSAARGAVAPVGFLSPILYAMGAANQSSLLNDVTSGSNGAYTAGPGWDAVTGFGSMKAQPLLAFLKSH